MVTIVNKRKGDALASAKRKLLVNQAEIARRLNVSKQYVNLLLKGKRKNDRRLEEIRKLLAEEIECLDFVPRQLSPDGDYDENNT